MPGENEAISLILLNKAGSTAGFPALCQAQASSLTSADLLWNYPTIAEFQISLCTFFCKGLINGPLFRKKSPDVGEHGSFFLLSLELWLEIIGSVTGSNQKWQSLGYKAFAWSLTIPPQNKT